MSAPFDRPAHGEPGGCECFDCGVIFVGAPWHTQCAVCAAQGMEARQGGDANAAPSRSDDSPVPAGNAPVSPRQDISDVLIEALEAALAVHGDSYSWGPKAIDALRQAKGGSDAS
jgi:hypothetical protein